MEEKSLFESASFILTKSACRFDRNTRRIDGIASETIGLAFACGLANLAMASRRVFCSTGVVKCPSHPAAKLFSLSPFNECAVKATIGTRGRQLEISQARIS